MSKIIDLESARLIHDANETLADVIDIMNEMSPEQLYALHRKEAEITAKNDPTITLGKGPEDFDSKNIYLRTTIGPGKIPAIVGLHAIGHAGPYEYKLHHQDGTVETRILNFMAIETWGNEYDDEHNMLGRGSFRLHTTDIEQYARDMEAEGWQRYEGPKRKGQSDKT